MQAEPFDRQKYHHAERLVPVGKLHQLKTLIRGVIKSRSLMHHIHVSTPPVLLGKGLTGSVLLIKLGCPYPFKVYGVEEVHQVQRVRLFDHLLDQPVGMLRCPAVNNVHRGRVAKIDLPDSSIEVRLIGLDEGFMNFNELVGKMALAIESWVDGRSSRGPLSVFIIGVDLLVAVPIQVQRGPHGRLGLTGRAVAGHHQGHAQAQRGDHEVGILVQCLFRKTFSKKSNANAWSDSIIFFSSERNSIRMGSGNSPMGTSSSLLSHETTSNVPAMINEKKAKKRISYDSCFKRLIKIID